MPSLREAERPCKTSFLQTYPGSLCCLSICPVALKCTTARRKTHVFYRLPCCITAYLAEEYHLGFATHAQCTSILLLHPSLLRGAKIFSFSPIHSLFRLATYLQLLIFQLLLKKALIFQIESKFALDSCGSLGRRRFGAFLGFNFLLASFLF